MLSAMNLDLPATTMPLASPNSANHLKCPPSTPLSPGQEVSLPVSIPDLLVPNPVDSYPILTSSENDAPAKFARRFPVSTFAGRDAPMLSSNSAQHST